MTCFHKNYKFYRIFYRHVHKIALQFITKKSTTQIKNDGFFKIVFD